MKKIEAIIHHFKLDEVVEVLRAIGVTHVVVTEARSFGRQRARSEIYRASVEYGQDFIPKTKIEMTVPDDLQVAVVEAIVKTARTDKGGDGKVLVMNVVEATSIHTGKKEG